MHFYVILLVDQFSNPIFQSDSIVPVADVAIPKDVFLQVFDHFWRHTTLNGILVNFVQLFNDSSNAHVVSFQFSMNLNHK